METSIGIKLRGSRVRLWLAFVAMLFILDSDFLLIYRWAPGYQWYRSLLACIGATVMLGLCGWDLKSLGLVLKPVQGYRYWVKAGILIGIAVLGFSLLIFVSAYIIGHPMPMPKMNPSRAKSFLFIACVQAPLVEEMLYRLVLCVPFAALAGSWFTIIVSGCVFAALHFVYGNPGPDNFIAGFFLGWAYLKSRSIVIPILFHSIGNAFVVLINLGFWYLTH
jgi:membrane protease YdiL (CAAX protease family)